MPATLTDKRHLAALRRLGTDFSFWAERCYRILNKRREIVPLRLNRVQRALEKIEAEERERARVADGGRVRIYILKGRQGGVSTYQQAKNLHLIWARRGVRAMTLAQAEDDMRKIFEITQRAIDHFPEGFLWSLGDARTTEVRFASRDSAFYTGTAGSKRTGHGPTLDRLHATEFCFWPQPKETLAAISPAIVPGGTIVLETTADRYESEGHNFWREAIAGQNGYRPVFFPWWDCDWELYRLPLLAPDELEPLEEDEKQLMERHGLTLEHIKWRREGIREYGRAEFLRQYAEDPNTCWLVAGHTFYEADLLQALWERRQPPKQTVSAQYGTWSGELAIYGEPGTESVIIGCDVAEGSGGDRSAVVARTFPSWRLVFYFEDRRIWPEQLADLLNDWGHRLGKAFLVIEKNAHGITVLRRLRDKHNYPTRSVYYRTQIARPYQERQELMGWVTSGESKPLLLDAGRSLLQSAREGRVEVPPESALQDAFAVVRDEQGRVELTGRDALVAEMLAWIGREEWVKRRPKVTERVTW